MKAIEHYEPMAEHGRHRRYASAAAIPVVMWYVVVLGTIINFGLMWSFDMRFATQLFLGGMVALFLGVLILLIAVLDRPYRSLEFGVGQVVLTTRGPVERMQLKPGQKFLADGNYVVARTGDVAFNVCRPTRNWLGRLTSGEGWLRVYQGPGRLLLNPAPYWRYRVFSARAGASNLPAQATA